MASRAASTGLALVWGEEDPNCNTCAPVASAMVPSATSRAPWRSGSELRKSVGRDHGHIRAAPPSEAPDTVFDDMSSSLYVPHRHVTNNAEWAEMVALLYKAAQPGAVPDVEVGAALRERVSGSAVYERFVDAVIRACRSPRATRLGVEKYTIDERSEGSQWTPITLTVWFSDRGIDAKIDAWGEMRRIVDERIVPLRDGGGDEMRGIDSRFFISLGSRYV